MKSQLIVFYSLRDIGKFHAYFKEYFGQIRGRFLALYFPFALRLCFSHHGTRKNSVPEDCLESLRNDTEVKFCAPNLLIYWKWKTKYLCDKCFSWTNATFDLPTFQKTPEANILVINTAYLENTSSVAQWREYSISVVSNSVMKSLVWEQNLMPVLGTNILILKMGLW